LPELAFTKNIVVPETLVTLKAPSADESLMCSLDNGLTVPNPTKALLSFKNTLLPEEFHICPTVTPDKEVPSPEKLVAVIVPETSRAVAGLVFPIPTFPEES